MVTTLRSCIVNNPRTLPIVLLLNSSKVTANFYILTLVSFPWNNAMTFEIWRSYFSLVLSMAEGRRLLINFQDNRLKAMVKLRVLTLHSFCMRTLFPFTKGLCKHFAQRATAMYKVFAQTHCHHWPTIHNFTKGEIHFIYLHCLCIWIMFFHSQALL